MKDRWRLYGPWRRTFLLLNIMLILNLVLIIGACLLHPLIIVVYVDGGGTGFALVQRFPFLLVFVLAIVGSALSAVVTPMDHFPEKKFRIVALFIISWAGTITYLITLYFQNLWFLFLSPITGYIPLEPYPGYWAEMGLQNIIGTHLTMLPALMLLGFFGIIVAYLFQYWILG